MADDSKSYNGSDALATVSQDGVVPQTRFASADAVQSFGRRLWEQDAGAKRGVKRAKVNGLIAGFPPYNSAKLREAGRADACNANFGTARSYVESACSAFYDLTSEAPGHFAIFTDHGNEEQKIEWSRTMSMEADRIWDRDRVWDYERQQSIWQMVVHSPGPLFFEDSFRVFPRAIESGALRTAERTLSDTEYWEVAFLDLDLYPPQLYKSIMNREVAEQVGWDYGYTMKVLANAMDVRQTEGRSLDAEFYAQELKNNSMAYYDDSKVCKLYHAFWMEFDGRITHAIVERESGTPEGCQYLFIKHGRYQSWQQAIHPFYYDRGDNGYHHSATGLGVKFYAALEYQNRLMCNLHDKAFAPKQFFTPGSAESKEKFQLAKYGDWGLLPFGTQILQTPIQGFLTDGLAMFRTSSDLMRANLSQYRQPVEMQKPGNPATAFEKKMEASQEGSLSNTTFARYYVQMDALCTEIVRRLCNLNTIDDRAKEFQKRCLDAGVPKECFGRLESVKAVRVVGAGSAFMRQNILTALAPYVQGNEEGMGNWRDDLIAAHAGQSAVSRYAPKRTQNKLASQQQFDATEAVAMAKLGIPAPIVGTQNAMIFAATFLKAATDSLNSVQQGSDPKEVLAFIQICGQSAAAHLKRMESDPLRKQMIAPLEDQLKRLGAATDKLKAMVQKAAQQQKAQQGKTRQAMTDEQLATRKLLGDEQRKNAKLQFQLKRDAAKTKMQLDTGKQNILLQDARTAADIHRNRLKAFQE